MQPIYSVSDLVTSQQHDPLARMFFLQAARNVYKPILLLSTIIFFLSYL